MEDDNKVDFRLLTENSVDMVCFVGLDMVMTYVSPSCEQILGWHSQEMCGKGPADFVLKEDLPVVAAAEQKLFTNGVDYVPTTVRMRKKDGSPVWVEIYARMAKDEVTGQASGIVLSMRDVTKRKLREEALEALAKIDSLTGLANRRTFDQSLDREWKRAFREKSNLSLILMDLDYFKQFNDHYGHLRGDECLRTVAETIGKIVSRASDVIARFGGEEIAIILPVTELNGARQLAESLRHGIEELQIPHEGRTDCSWVTVSLGVASAYGGAQGAAKMPDDLLYAADEALYQAKKKGRNQVVVSSFSVSR